MSMLRPLRFRPGYFEKIWGGHKIHRMFDSFAPADRPVGEAWLIADHPNHQSVVAEGPLAGVSLRHLLEQDAAQMLGRRPQLTLHGRFPLLLKLLDAGQALSVQVHPDDQAALRLGEPDVGKTEMWHVLQADDDAKLICGLKPGLSREAFGTAVREGVIEQQMECFAATPGTTVFVPAGTVHAIGAGIVLAEIQQNSDITYRIYDWGRLDDAGNPRELHLEKSVEVSDLEAVHSGPARPLSYPVEDTTVSVLGACRYFAGDQIRVHSTYTRNIWGESFHLLLGAQGSCTVVAGEDEASIAPGQAVLIPGAVDSYTLTGPGEVLDYYVPDLARDIVTPLMRAGHASAAIVQLGGAPARSDLAAFV